MQLNDFTDYSLRVLVYAAVHQGGRCTASDVAAAFDVSRHHLVKVINELQHLGYLETTRGRGGGFRLALGPERVSVGDVVRRTEGSLALVECFNHETNTCPLTKACGLKAALGEAFEAFFAVLDGYTLADLVAQPQWTARVMALAQPAHMHAASHPSST